MISITRQDNILNKAHNWAPRSKILRAVKAYYENIRCHSHYGFPKVRINMANSSSLGRYKS